ncbi:hypothetical protein A9Q96_10065 [Rhodobacterales bacterium 52_120_T64]|nr:hypothetical protein A9Q96_10065 [Rhodobacterales bacterium 52_120_T64]
MRFFSCLVLAFCIFGNAALSATDIFTVRSSDIYVIDGDTVGIGESRYRLAGIDACELGQQALNESSQYFDCGAVGTKFLQSFLDGSVTIAVLGRDKYDRKLAIFYDQSGRDINGRMVLNGWAVAYYSNQYAETRNFLQDSNFAQSQGVGLWAGEFVMPSEHRKNPERSPRASSPSLWDRLIAYIFSL